ncbi:MAG: hypothetical protein QNL59_07575 [Actinomycetota bacterium]
MSRFTRSARMVVACGLFVSTAVLFAASPANAAATGSLANDGNGGLVVTYSSPTAQDSIDLEIKTSGSNCNDQQLPLAVLTNNSQAPQAAQIGASPATIAVGTTAFLIGGGTFTVAAASYLFCLRYFDSNTLLVVFIDQLTMTIGSASPTTTTTTTLPTTTTTTTAPAADPVAPAFTG